MKILHTADWHIGTFPGPEKDGINLRGQDVYDCLDFLVNTATEEKPDLILVSGDIFHAAKVWADRALNETHRALDVIRRLAAIATVCVLRGTPNHDGDEHFDMLHEALAGNEAIEIISTPKMIPANTKSGPVDVAALPGFSRGDFRAKFPGLSQEEENKVFTEELGKIVMGLRAEATEGIPSVLMAHYTVPGSNTESGQTQFLAQFEPMLMPEVLDSAGFDLVALGHIHRPQKVGTCLNTYYSGAINALNFNDEGQERGFWIHELEDKRLESRFVVTPHRKFKTIKLDHEQIESINGGLLDFVAQEWAGEVKDKVVRVLYSCTDEANKALSKSSIEKKLYEEGAFWVQEITPERITITATRQGLSEKDSPEDNLRDYLMEKSFPEDKIVDILEAAEPIIAEAIAGDITGTLTGLFMPVEIEVKNYRNYVEETFNFKDVTFCTINGPNGVGKSSLFMDAILDCLYEEPREGDLTGWIRNDEKARSGSIKFTFRIGEKEYRVTRTRQKSGRATLNLSEFVDGEWEDRSDGERMAQIQSTIVQTLGMDSLAMKSCALIMQDQYGLFLQANKEDRMKILGNILGLGIYEVMEKLAREQATETNRTIRSNKEQASKLEETLPNEDEINAEIATIKENAKQNQVEMTLLVADEDKLKLRLNTKKEAATRAQRVQAEINNLIYSKTNSESLKLVQEDIKQKAEAILSREPEILDGVAKLKEYEEQERDLIAGKATYDSALANLEKSKEEAETTKRRIAEQEAELASLATRKQPLDLIVAQEAELALKSAEYDKEKLILTNMESNSQEYIRLSNSIAEENKKLAALQSTFDTGYSKRVTEYRVIREKANLLTNSNCIDPENANCKFLADAKEAQSQLVPYQQESQTWKAEMENKLQLAREQINNLTKERDQLEYEPSLITAQQAKVRSLEDFSKRYATVQNAKEQLALLNERVEATTTSKVEADQALQEAETSIAQKGEELKLLEGAATKHKEISAQIAAHKKYLDEQASLPAARERKEFATTRLVELIAEIEKIEADLGVKQTELAEELVTAEGGDTLEKELAEVASKIKTIKDRESADSMRLGALEERLVYSERTRKKLKELQVEIVTLSDKAVIYEELKNAFSQDGVPHNIIRSIVPMLEATATNILGQMSGGKMSMEFITEKVLKSNAKEVVTLDIIITEEGIGSLPYLSKSGGERVKSSLSAILALAEIKSKQAGIQLGMLMIDEPPFLDSEGSQAYVDALETIQQRYSDLKIMAITHDPAMKARFPQSIDVTKTEQGSKIAFN